MTWTFRSLWTYRGWLAWAVVLVGLTWFQYDPDGYVGNRPDLRHLIAPALRTVRLATLLGLGLGFVLAAFVVHALTVRVHGRSTRRQLAGLGLLLAAYAGGWWLGQRAFRGYFADEYYIIWKYQYEEKEARPVLASPTLLPQALRDVRNRAEPGHSRDKLAFALGFAGAQPAFPVLQALAQDRTQDAEFRLRCLLALRVLDAARFHTLLPALPADTALALYHQHQQRYQ